MNAVDLLAALESVVGILPAAPRHDEGTEQRMVQVAESWCPETRQYRRLGRRWDR